MNLSSHKRCAKQLSIGRGATFITSLGVILLLSLGTWQLYRLRWKQSLISKIEARLHLPYQKLNTLFSYEKLPQLPQTIQDIEFYPVEITGTFVPAFFLKLQGRLHQQKLGYHLIKLLKITDTANVIVDCGWMPLSSGLSLPLQEPQRVSLKGYIRLKSERNFMTPPNQYDHHEIYALDPVHLAQDLNIKNCLPFYIIQTQDQFEQDPSILPLPNSRHISLRNSHLSYAITWYSLAFVLITVYILSRRRVCKQSEKKVI